MKKFLLIFGFLFLWISTPVLAQDSAKLPEFQEKDVYQRIYRDLTARPYEIALERVALRNEIAVPILLRILERPTVASLEQLSFCPDELTAPEQITRCYEQIKAQFTREHELAEWEIAQFFELNSVNLWANGTLADSSFDIIVDLNIVDVIIFGPNATLPAPRLSGAVLEALSPAHDRRYGDLVDPLRRPGTDFEPGTPNDPPDPDDSGDSGDDEEEGADENDPDEPLMCTDPDALFLIPPDDTADSGDSSGNEGNSGNGNDDSDDANIPQELPDFAGADENFTRGVFPDLEEIEAEEMCTGDQVPFFNGLLCAPKFCTDLICVFTELKPGRTFSLKSQETPLCINCIIQRAYQVLETIEKTVEAPQRSSNVRYKFTQFFKLFGSGSNMEFYAIPKAPPVIRAPEQSPLTDIFADPDNYELAEMILNPDCRTVLDILPADAIVTTAEIMGLCEHYKNEKDTVQLEKIIPQEVRRVSRLTELSRDNLQDEVFQELHSYFQGFRSSLQDFTNATAPTTVEKIQAIDIVCTE